MAAGLKIVDDATDVMLPLEGGVLTVNLGLPIMLLGLKVRVHAPLLRSLPAPPPRRSASGNVAGKTGGRSGEHLSRTRWILCANCMISASRN